MPSALFIMLERKKMTSYHARARATQLHLALHSVASVLLGIGGIAVFREKQASKHGHLSTTHSWAGAILMLLAALNLVQGVLLTVEKQPMNWQWRDETHVFVGTLAYILSALTTLYGLYTSSWGHERLGEQRQTHLAIIITLAHVVLLGKAIVISRKRHPHIKRA
ncbi:hypothetical protein PINS_up012459 [Pythium insidiosum]|nr:hypothetical protein PINS_up012459 [Pythium insidiosum]